jgi:hypothetical protein
MRLTFSYCLLHLPNASQPYQNSHTANYTQPFPLQGVGADVVAEWAKDKSCTPQSMLFNLAEHRQQSKISIFDFSSATTALLPDFLHGILTTASQALSESALAR